jgi:hypothetical protein
MIKMKLLCPHCDVSLRIPDQAAGRVLPCPGCKQHVTIPHPEEQEAEPIFEPESEEDFEVLDDDTPMAVQADPADEKPAQRTSRKKRRRKKAPETFAEKNAFWLQSPVLKLVLGGLAFVIFAALGFWAVSSLFQTPAPADIPDLGSRCDDAQESER